MRHPLFRSVLSACLTVCFAMSVVGWGSMPGCTLTGAVADHGVAHAGDTGHRHSHGQSHAPGRQVCVVHHCCAHLALQPSTPSAGERFAEASTITGFTSASAVVAVRVAHVLPFAHAPPRPIV
jgi:hypothetical protein